MHISYLTFGSVYDLLKSAKYSFLYQTSVKFFLSLTEFVHLTWAVSQIICIFFEGQQTRSFTIFDKIHIFKILINLRVRIINND